MYLWFKVHQFQRLASVVIVQRDKVAAVFLYVLLVTHSKGDAVCHFLARLPQLQHDQETKHYRALHISATNNGNDSIQFCWPHQSGEDPCQAPAAATMWLHTQQQVLSGCSRRGLSCIRCHMLGCRQWCLQDSCDSGRSTGILMSVLALCQADH
jgi:hypothetical protein